MTTAVARGDLSQMIEVPARGEILALKVLRILSLSFSLPPRDVFIFRFLEYGQFNGAPATRAGSRSHSRDSRGRYER